MNPYIRVKPQTMTTFERTARIDKLQRRRRVIEAQIADLQNEAREIAERLHFLENNEPLPAPDLTYKEAVARWQRQEESHD